MKRALVVTAADVDVLNPAGIFDLIKTLALRSGCETDESLLQLIPYITLIDKTSRKIFIYSRGKGGDENRLTGLCSIGLGGHIETLPAGICDIYSHIATDALRELNEEVGIIETDELFNELKDKLESGDFQLIYDDSTSVGRVHLGIGLTLEIDMDEHIFVNEENVITKGVWYTKEQLNWTEVLLETWSTIVLNSLVAKKLI